MFIYLTTSFYNRLLIGDQHFWGKMIHERGAGPEPLPKKEFTMEKFVERIQDMPSMEEKAKELGKKIDEEDGIGKAIQAIQQHIPEDTMLCDVCHEMGSKTPAAVVCLDCKLKLCNRDNHIGHFIVPEMLHHRRHRIRVCAWKHTDSKLSHALADGFGEMTSTWRQGITDIASEPLNKGKEEGALGVVKGLGKGAASLATKTVTAPIHLVTATANSAFSMPYEDLPHGVTESYGDETSEEVRSIVLSCFQRLIHLNIKNFKK